jgi:hypothetical protein
MIQSRSRNSLGIKFRHTPGRDQVQIERKDEMKKRRLKLPDRADAVVMAYLR